MKFRGNCQINFVGTPYFERRLTLTVRFKCFVLGLSLAGLLVVLPASGQQAGSAPATATADTPAAASPAPQDQTPASASAPAATPAPAPTWSIGPIDFAGTIDGYYSWNAQHPADKTNELYSFDGPANTFSLNMAKLSMSHSPDPVGFEFDLMFGNTATAFSAAAQRDSFFDDNVEQAYVSFKPAKAKGFEVDFGKFVTTAGAEVIESYSNWNYSRSLLFTWAIPLFHFGLRTSFPMGKHLTAGVQVVNGWNNDFSSNSRATLGANIMATYSKWSLMEDWYGGPDNEAYFGEPGSTKGWRELFDTVLTLTPSSKWGMYVNYDYGQNRNYGESFTYNTGIDPTAFPDGSLARWSGVAAAIHYMPTSKWSFTPRFEVFDDANGGALLGQDNLSPSGIEVQPIRQTVKEITVTGEYKLLAGLLWRAEYRYDWSNKPFFERGAGTDFSEATCRLDTPGGCPAAFGLQNSKDQSTITVAFIGYFGPKR
jgi:hypothetical protein